MITHPLLVEVGVPHGFGLRDTPDPATTLLRPRQVHGIRVVRPVALRADPAPEADAVVSSEPGVAVGVVTADCVPVLLASRCGRAVGAVHAGWRGLAAGVVAQGVDALRQELRGAHAAGSLVAVVGPHIGACCYEVDAPVLDALRARFGAIDDAVRPARPGHAQLDLGVLVARELRDRGLAADAVGRVPDACTACDPQRFHSYRRDGERAGRLWHFVAAVESTAESTAEKGRQA